MLRSRGLRLSLLGAICFALGGASLLFLPHAVSIIGMLAGGLCVWAGFVWTIFRYYSDGFGSDSP